MAARGDINSQDVEPILFEKWVKLDFKECLDKTGEFSKLKSGDYFEKGQYPVIDQGEKYISGFVNDKNLLYKGELPIIIFGDHTRIFKYVTDAFAVGADGTKILKPIKSFDPKFFFYYMSILAIPSLGYSRHFKILNTIKVPLPPLPEQQRIVAKLDTLLGQLDRIKASMERIPQLLKDFRQKVLTQAVTGKLTEEWREGRELETIIKKLKLKEYTTDYRAGWIRTNISEVSTSISGFAFKSNIFTDEGFQLIRMGNLYQDKLDLSRNPVFIPNNFDNKLVEKYTARPNSILLSLTGTKYKRDYGYAIKVPDGLGTILVNQRILNLIPKIDSTFFLYLLRSELFRDQFFSFETGGVNQGNVGSKAVESIEMCIPSFEEQQEIVSRVEYLFAKADRIEASYQKLKAKLGQLPQALLAKAFRGELVEQLPTDGDARDLLEQIKKLNTDNK